MEEKEVKEVSDSVIKILKEAVNSPNRKVKRMPEYYNTYKMGIDFMEQIKVHAEKGVFPEELFKLRSPNETDEEFNYRKVTYKQITLPVFMDFLSVQQRAFNDNNWSIEYAKDKDVYVNGGETFQKYVEEDIHIYGSVENFIFNYMVTNKSIDANGVIAVKPKVLDVNENGEINADTLVKPQPTYYPCSRVLAHLEDEYFLIESYEKSTVEYYNKPEKKGYVFEFYDKENIWKIYQVGKFIDFTFEIKLYFNHNCKELPVKILGGIPRIYEDDVIYQSPFLFAVDNLDLAVLDSSNLSISKSRTAFPIPVMYGQTCEFYDKENNIRCNDGVLAYPDGEKSCQACNGTGLKTRLNPMIGLLLKPKNGLEGGDDFGAEPLKYVSPSPEILKFLDEQIDKHISRSRKIMHLPDSDESVQNVEGQTATGSDNKLKGLYSFIKPISDQVFDLYDFTLRVIGKMRYGDNFQGFRLNRPTIFDFKTEEDYLADIDTAFRLGLPPLIINTILFNYLKTFYYTDSVSSKVLKLLNEGDRLFGLTSEEITMKLAKGLIAPYEDIIHSSGITLVQNLMLENPEFLNQDFDKQLEGLFAKAKEVEVNIKPQSLTDSLLGGADSPTSALSGSVGGLTGMIEIVKAVSSGIYDLDAAIALVQQRFGLSEVEARKQLGTPQTIISQAKADTVATLV